jgi:tetratricopeptide (TPR) repeat protein
VLADLAAGQPESARKWLDWVRDDVKATGGDDELSGPTFPRLWAKGVTANDSQVRIAAASLIAHSPDGAEALPVLREAVKNDGSDPKRDYIELTYLIAAAAADQWEEAVPVAQSLAERHPESAMANTWAVNVLCKAGQNAAAEKQMAKWLNSDPDNLEAQRVRISVLQRESKFEAAEAQALKTAEASNSGPQDWNEYGWIALVAGDLTPEKVEAVRRGVGNTNVAPILHTLASLAAEVGKGSEAREQVLGAMANWGFDEPDDACWYVFGRIAELYGVKDAAITYYSKLTAPKEVEDSNISTYALAQRRLKALR